MSKTRNLSDLLDANGDVKSTALDNVPASDDASALTTGTLDNARLSTNVSVSGDLTVDTDTLKVDSTNNRVGVNTTSPDNPLEVVDNTGLNLGLKVSPSVSGSSTLQLKTWNDSADNRNWAFRNRYNQYGTLELMRSTDSTSQPLTTVMSFHNNSRVGIGTTSPSSLLHVNGDIRCAGLIPQNVYLGGTGSANALDDYEEGTFTPTISANGSASSGATYSLQEGYYLKVGENVLVHARLLLTNKGSGTGSCGIGSLPFAPRDNYSGVNYEYFGSTMYNNLQNMGSNIINVALVHTGNAMIGFAMSAAGGANNFALLDMSNLTNTSDIRATVWYQTSS